VALDKIGVGVCPGCGFWIGPRHTHAGCTKLGAKAVAAEQAEQLKTDPKNGWLVMCRAFGSWHICGNRDSLAREIYRLLTVMAQKNPDPEEPVEFGRIILDGSFIGIYELGDRVSVSIKPTIERLRPLKE
jgi:hypothetical protein